MKSIYLAIVLFVAGIAAASGQITPYPGVLTPCSAIQTTNCTPQNDGNGIATPFRNDVNQLTASGLQYQFGEDAKGTTASAGASGDISSNSRVCSTSVNGMTQVALWIHGTYQSGTPAGSENPWGNAHIFRWALEYPVGTVSTQGTYQGQATFAVQPGANIITDPLGAMIPANTQYCIRLWSHVPQPPTGTPTATTNATVGTLSNVAYYYKIDRVELGVRSGPSAEFTQTANANTSLALAWTEPTNTAPGVQAWYNIYRGTSSNGEVLIATIPAPATTFLDTGINNVTSTQAITTQPTLFYSGYIKSGDSSNGNYGANGVGNYADVTGSTGAIATYSGPANKYNMMPFLVLSDDTTQHPVYMFGDSIPAGLGFVATSGLGSGVVMSQNWFNAAFTAGAQSAFNMSIPGAKISLTLTQAQSAQSRFAAFPFATGSYVIDELQRNDIYAGNSWQTIASYQLAFGKLLAQRGVKLYLVTGGPNTASSCNFTCTINGDQTQINSGDNTARVAYNQWIRAGSQTQPVNTGTVTTSGTAVTGSGTNFVTSGAWTGLPMVINGVQYYISSVGSTTSITLTTSAGTQASAVAYTVTVPCNTAGCGTKSPYVYGYFDFSAAIPENDINGNVVQDGGYWPIPSTTYATGCTLTGSPSQTSFTVTSSSCTITSTGLAGNWTSNTLAGYSIIMTSGTYSGDTAMISNSTSTTALTLYANGAAAPCSAITLTGLPGSPSSGDTFKIVAGFACDGVHMLYAGHTAVATGANGFTTWVTNNLKP